jgi:cell division protein FtsB
VCVTLSGVQKQLDFANMKRSQRAALVSGEHNLCTGLITSVADDMKSQIQALVEEVAKLKDRVHQLESGSPQSPPTEVSAKRTRKPKSLA